MAKAKSSGVLKIVLPATSEENSFKGIKMAKKYDGVYASAGIHPCDAFTGNEADFLEKVNPEDIVAIGETGIDLYHMDTNPPLEKQIISFKKHIKWALE